MSISRVAARLEQCIALREKLNRAEFHPDTGLTSTLAMFPLETIRTRLAVDPKKYRNMLGAFHTIVEAEGAGALYRVCL